MVIWIPLMALLAYRSLPWKRIASTITIAIHGAMAIVTPWLWMHGLKDYQRDRLVLFLDPSQDPLGGGYHLLQSTVGIGSGGLFRGGTFAGSTHKTEIHT
jgi:rod shape determining protein RodA